MNLRKKLGTVAAGVALAVGGGLLAPQMASAAGAQATATNYGCPGSQIDSYALYSMDGKDLYGHAYLYYSSANGGTNCAVYVTAIYPGIYREMFITIMGAGKVVRDFGLYVKYAGPVTLTGMDGHCVALDLEENPPSGDSHRELSNLHCG